MDTFFVIPRRNILTVYLETIAAVIDFAQSLRNILDRLLLHIFSSDQFSMLVSIAAQAKHMIDLLFCKRKSEGRTWYTLRFINLADLLRFRQEQVKA